MPAVRAAASSRAQFLALYAESLIWLPPSLAYNRYTDDFQLLSYYDSPSRVLRLDLYREASADSPFL